MPSTGPPAVEIENLTRRFGGVTALDRVSLSIRQGEFFSLLGPSGCGKTTLLRIIAGLDLPDEGGVRISGLDAARVPAHRRPVNTVFQSYALFPHLNVWENVAFGLRMKKTPRLEIDSRVRKIMNLVEIEPLAQRKPAQLSGGQKQRVALARAVVNEPRVLLLDEPLGALDLKLRKQLQVELRNLQRRLEITFLYVTHDQEEALVLSDRIAVMHDGRIEQLGDAASLYERPRTRFTSQFLGSCTLLEATLARPDGGDHVAATPVGELRIAGSLPPRERFTLAIRPEKIQLWPVSDSGGENRFRVRIEQIIYVGAETHYELRAGPQLLRAEVMNAQAGAQGYALGQEAMACLPPGALIVLDD
jgi:spermidine/putrescine transport system ATP-binding protein